MTLQQTASKFGGVIKNHAPEILTGISLAGLGGTAYLTSRAGFRAGLKVMAETSRRMDETPDDAEVQLLTPKEIIKETWTYYIPAIIVGIATATAIVGSNRISHGRNVALFSAAAIAEQTAREYQNKVVEATSTPKERKIQDEIAQDAVTNKADEINKLVLQKDGDVVCIEMHTKNTFVSNAEKIHRAENEAVRIGNEDGYVSLNTFLDLLGLPTSEAGEVVGWSAQRKLEVVIGGAAHDEKPVLTINYRTPPTVTYMNPF